MKSNKIFFLGGGGRKTEGANIWRERKYVYSLKVETMERYKLDRVGPVDNRPSPKKHHNFVKKGTYDT